MPSLPDHWRRVFAAALLAALGGAGVLLFTSNGSKTPPGVNGKPVAATPSQLAELARSLHHPIYWLGPQAGETIEVTHISADTTFIRYLTAGTRVGDPRPSFITVGTYLRGSALNGLRSVAKQPRHRKIAVSGGGLAVTSTGRGKVRESVYVAYPGSDYQIEVYAPKPGEALHIVRSRQIRSLG